MELIRPDGVDGTEGPRANFTSISSIRTINSIKQEGGRNSVVECDLPKVEVASSNLVARSSFPSLELLDVL